MANKRETMKRIWRDAAQGKNKSNVNNKSNTNNLSIYADGYVAPTKKSAKTNNGPVADLGPVQKKEKNSLLFSSVGSDWIGELLAPIKEEENMLDKVKLSTGGINSRAGEFFVGATNDQRKWFQKGEFEDGYQRGDITKTILGSASDFQENFTQGLLGIGETAIDAGAYALGAIGKATGGSSEKIERFIKKDLINEEAISKNIFSRGALGVLSDVAGADTEKSSVLAERSDSLIQSTGQLGGQIALQAVGVPWYVTTGATSFGAEAENALNQGATFGQAGASAAIKAGSDILTEKLFGGSGLGEKGLINVDKFTKGISNKVVKTLFDYGIDVVGEGGEEVAASFFSKLGDAIYKDESFWELATSEEAVDEYLESFVGGAVLGGGMNSVKAVQSAKNKTDYRTGLSANEQKLFDSVFKEMVKNEEDKNGNKLTAKEKKTLEQNALEYFKKGYVDTETIEDMFGGETYKEYKSVLEQEAELKKAYEEAGHKSDQGLDYIQQDAQKKAYEDAKAKYEEFQNSNKKSELRERLDQEIGELTKNDQFIRESYNEKTRKGQSFEADLTKYDAKQAAVVQKAVDSGILNNTNRTHEFVDWIANIAADKDASFDFTNNEKLKESGFSLEGKTVNGFVKDGNITLNIQSAKALNTVVGHEIAHVMEGTEMYDVLQKAVEQYGNTKGEFTKRYEAAFEAYKNVYKNMSEQKYAEAVKKEVVADMIGDYVFTDTNFVNNLSKEQPNIFQKIYEEIKYLVKVAIGTKEAVELEKVKRVFDKAYKDSAKTEKTTNETKFSIAEIKGQKASYGEGVLLDTDLFDGVHPRDWGKNLKEHVYNNMAGQELTVYNDGKAETIYLAKTNDTVKKDGAKNSHKVIDKLARHRHGDNTRALTTVHIGELAETSKYADSNKENSHQWLDKNGWEFRTAYAMDNKGRIYEMTLNIAKSRDGRNILYDINKIKKIDEGDVSSNATQPKHQSLKKSISQNSENTTKPDENIQYTISDNTKLTTDPDIRFSLSEDSDGNAVNEKMQKWAKNTKAVDENGNLKVLHHGTATGEFTVFDKQKASPEGDWGAGFYLTDSEADVEANYEDGGPDFENKVSRLAEQIESEEEIDYDEAVEIARERLYKGGYKIDAYVKIENPAIVGETYILDESDIDEDILEDYDGDTYAYYDDKIYELVEDVASDTDLYGNTNEVMSLLMDAVYEGGIEVQELKNRLNELYLEDSDGNFIANEVARSILENLGYDGIIDSTVSSKWNMDMEEGTTHYIVFKPNQIKNISNQNPTENPDINLSLSDQNQNIAPKGRFLGKDFNTYGSDIALDSIAPLNQVDAQQNVAENIAPSAETIKPDETKETTVIDDIKPSALTFSSTFRDVSETPFGNYKSAKQTADVSLEELSDEMKQAEAEFEKGVLEGEGKEEHLARILTAEELQNAKKENPNKRRFAICLANLVDKGLPFENLALKTNNRELMGKWNYTLLSEGRGQRLIGKGSNDGSVKSLQSIEESVINTGHVKEFETYMYHQLNIDRMTLQDRFGVNNKPVYGDTMTADRSRQMVEVLENKYPQFAEQAKDLYRYNEHLRDMMVESGIITQSTADLWAKMYPHYIPIKRKDGGFDNAPVDTTLKATDPKNVGVNAPIWKATGGNSNFTSLFTAMSERTLQTIKAIDKNSFGIELKNTLGKTSVVENKASNIDEIVDSLSSPDAVIHKSVNGKPSMFTVFENGNRTTFRITDEMYEALKPMADNSPMLYTNKVINKISRFRKGLITEYNPVFCLTNGIKDIQDVILNSQHPLRTYKCIAESFAQIKNEGHWFQEYMENGGEQNTYFDRSTATIKKDDTGLKKLAKLPLQKISDLNNFIEKVPRLAEYIASREEGRSVEVSMLDAARVTTNFNAGGDFTKMLDRNGCTFLNASTQGSMQQIRNFREARAEGMKGWVKLAAKFLVAGAPAILLNNFLWDDDEEYEELADYVKQNYYVVGKYDDGKFIRIPKGRAASVIQDALVQMTDLVTGDDDLDFKSFAKLVVDNIAPSNPIDNNILAPILQVAFNKTWYGEELVPSRLAELPDAEQFDETTDSFSKWLGEKTDISPVKINYLLDQYSGALGDLFLPMMTPKAESGAEGVGKLLAPLTDKFTTDSVINNQETQDFYTMAEELQKKANSMYATDEDKIRSAYMSAVWSDIGEWAQKKRETQNDMTLSNSAKYAMVRGIQKKINALAEDALQSYENVDLDGKFAEVGDRQFQINDNGNWSNISDEARAKQEEASNLLGITPAQYWDNEKDKYMYDWAVENPEYYQVSRAISPDLKTYWKHNSHIYNNIRADKDANGDYISGTKKPKIIDYINTTNLEYEQRLVLYKKYYPADDSHNREIINYLNARDDISPEEMTTILKELEFKVSADGRISW